MATTRTQYALRRSEALDEQTKRLLLALSGISLAAWGLQKRGLGRIIFAGAGAELLRRSVLNELPAILTTGSGASPEPIAASASITVRGDIQEIYRFWRNLANAPKYMPAVSEVREIGDTVSVWKFAYAGSRSFESTSEIVRDVPGELIEWNLIGSQLFRGSGLVRFAASTLEGYVEVQLEQWITPALPLTRGVTSAVLRRHLDRTLRNFKQLFETGEIATTKGQPSGERSFLGQVSERVLAPVTFTKPQAMKAGA